MKNLQGLIAFIEIVASGTLTAASDRLNISPAAVSKSLAKLERDLGVRLLNRSTRRISPTEEGIRFLLKAQDAMKLLDEAVDEVSQSASSPSGKVRLSVGVGFGRQWVLPALPALTSRYPQLQIDVDMNNQVVNLVSDGFDIAIRGAHVADSSMVVRHICALPVILVASPSYLKQWGVPNTPAQLQKHACAVPKFGTGLPTPWRFKTVNGEGMEVSPKPQLTTTEPESLVDLALAHAGIAQVALLQALPHLRNGTLKILLPDLHDGDGREFNLHYPHRLHLAPRVKVVVDALMTHFQQSADLHLNVSSVIKMLPTCVAS